MKANFVIEALNSKEEVWKRDEETRLLSNIPCRTGKLEHGQDN